MSECPARVAVSECPACSGVGELLGHLGTRGHFRCRACGADYSVAAAPEPTGRFERWLELVLSRARTAEAAEHLATRSGSGEEEEETDG